LLCFLLVEKHKVSVIIKSNVSHCTSLYILEVMVSVIASNAVDRRFEPQSGQTKDYKIGICCFSAKHAALRIKSKDWLALNQDYVSKSGAMSIRGLLFQ